MSPFKAETMTMLTNQAPAAAAACDPTDPTRTTSSWQSISLRAFNVTSAAGTILKLRLAHPDQQAGFFSIENPQAGPL